MSLTRRLRDAVLRTKRHPSSMDSDWPALRKVWPDGTWTMPYHGRSNAEMDEITRGTLLQAWGIEERSDRVAASGGQFGGGMGSAGPVEPDWCPSMAAIRGAAPKNTDPHYIAYVGARLESMGRLKS